MYYIKCNSNSAPLIVLNKLLSILKERNFLFSELTLISLLSKNRIIITTGIYQDLFGFLLKYLFNFRWISLIQCLPTRDLNYKNKSYFICFWLFLLRKSDFSISLSKSHQYALSILKIESQYIYINNLLFKEAHKFKYNNEEPLNIVFIGNDSKLKRSDFLLPLSDHYNLYFYGISKKTSSKNINYCGWSPNPWIKLKNNSIIVNPSLSEANPLILNEALRLGYPYVCTNLVPYKEFIKNPNVYTFRKYSIRHLLEVIEKINFDTLQIIKDDSYNIDSLITYIRNR